VKIIAIALLIILITGGFGFIVYRQVSRRQLKRAELSRRMRELELTVIRTQMNPHFMYNCLNSIQNLVQKNQNEQAHLYLSKFASLVRQVLNNSKKEEIPLSKELDSVQEYIELEQLRFDFGFKLEVAEGVDLNAIFVPPMLLQPFVENANLHGLLLKKSDRLLVIRIVKAHVKITLWSKIMGLVARLPAIRTRKGTVRGFYCAGTAFHSCRIKRGSITN
jgi:LytS/YehU family sensor histidine kinase